MRPGGVAFLPAALLAALLATGLGAAEASDAGAPEPATEAPKVAAGGPLDKFLHGLKQDGAVKLPEPVRAEMLALLPSARRGEECGEAAQASEGGQGLKDRGDGPVLLARISSCKGAYVMAFSPGLPLRAARLLDLEPEADSLVAASALNLRGGKREDELALQIAHAPHGADLHVLLRRDSGFSFAEAGVLRDTAAQNDCAPESEDAGSFASFVKAGSARRLQLLRIDSTCAGGTWQASCQLWTLEKGTLGKTGVCPLPPKLDARSLRAAGWR